MAAKKKSKAKKAAAKKAPKRAAAPKASAKKPSAAKKGRGTAKAAGGGAKGEVVYSDVLRELRSSLVSRLIR
jgi:hypothetical protein